MELTYLACQVKDTSYIHEVPKPALDTQVKEMNKRFVHISRNQQKIGHIKNSESRTFLDAYAINQSPTARYPINSTKFILQHTTCVHALWYPVSYMTQW